MSPRERKRFLARVGAAYGIAVFYNLRQYRDPAFNVFTPLGTKVFRAVPAEGGAMWGDIYMIEWPYLRICFIDRPGPLVEVVRLDRLR